MVENLTLNGFIKEMKEVSHGPHPRKFCFVLGAGASKSSGIKSGQDLVEIWDEELEERNSKEHQTWKEQNGITENNKASFYSEFYERRFKRYPADGYNYLEKLMGNEKPSIGYVMLAHLLTTTQHKVVITTNFDHLSEDAVNYYTEEIPLIIGHESLAHYVSHEINRPIIIKIHRDLLFDPKSKTEELRKLHDNWEKALETVFIQYHPIFIGYAGNDNSLMDFLIVNAEKFKNGEWSFPYWLSYKNESISEKVIEFLEKSNGYLIKHDGFDRVLYLLGAEFEYKLPEKDKFLSDAEKRFQELSDYIDEFTEIIRVSSGAEQDDRKNVVKTTVVETEEIEQAIQKITGQTELQRMFRESVILSNAGDFESALELRRKLVKMEPNSARYHNSLGDTLYRLEQYDEAIKEIGIAIELDPKNARYYYSYGKVLSELERYEEALEQYEKAIELEPEEAVYYSSISGILQGLRMYEDAILAIQEAIKLEPDRAWYYYEMGSILYEMGMYQEALQKFEMAINLEPSDSWYFAEMANVLNDMKEYEKALSASAHAIDLESDLAWYYLLRADILVNLERYDDAIAECKKGIKMAPEEGDSFKEKMNDIYKRKKGNMK
ncbi:MAG: tetratricopeptide repeat protein [Agathobacter sp.]|nr:tetratricopeptide repeat protein [Agathobacter sp.]